MISPEDASKDLELTTLLNSADLLSNAIEEPEDKDEELKSENSDSEETYEDAVKKMQKRALIQEFTTQSEGKAPVIKGSKEATTSFGRETVEDFLRNFLVSKKLFKTLDTFQNEWYTRKMTHEEMQEQEKVPDIYFTNAKLESKIEELNDQLDESGRMLEELRCLYSKCQRDRDFYRLHFKRITQEKTRSCNDYKSLQKKHNVLLEDAAKTATKQNSLIREKAMLVLERDKLSSQLFSINKCETCAVKSFKSKGDYFCASELSFPRSELFASGSGPLKKVGKKTGLSDLLPNEQRRNPYLVRETEPLIFKNMREVRSVYAHEMSVSCLSMHPTKMAIATGSDDCTWKLWNCPSGDLLMSGQGHQDWISSVDFSPDGTILSTSSGDKTIKLWDLSEAVESATLSEHTKPVWCSKFHDYGTLIASCSMDSTIKLWDLQTYLYSNVV